MGWRTRMIDGGEYDALTRMKRFLGWKPGVRKGIKRKHNKRQRRIAKNRLR